MKRTILYIHGQGGSPEEAAHYRSLFPDCEVIGFNYTAQTPWEAKEEFPRLLDAVCGQDCVITLIANSIGAYFAMNALSDFHIERAYFISPVVDMEKLIADMMQWANVSEGELERCGTIQTAFGQTLSWEYLMYAREHPCRWTIPTHILYGSQDNLTSRHTISNFAAQTGATLTVMDGGEHWFHAAEQMDFLDRWIQEIENSPFPM